MKISIVVAGRWHAIELARELHKKGYLHRVITNYPKYKTRGWGVPDDKVISLPLTLLLNKTIEKVGGAKLVRKSLPTIYRIFARDAVRYLEGSTLVHGWSSCSLPAIHWAKQNNVPFLLERSSTHINYQAKLLEVESQKFGIECTEIHPQIVETELAEYELADQVAVPSYFARRSFIEEGFPKDNLVYNRFGTNLETFSPGVKQDNVFRIVYAGTLSVRKGIYYLVKGFIQANIPNSELCLIGGATPETAQLIASEDARIKFIGHIPEPKLAEYYRNSSVFIMPSIEDGFPYVISQAIACGIPLICTTNTAGEDILRINGALPVSENNIDEYPAGYIIPPANSEAIALLLTKLAANPELLAQKQRNALAFNSQDLSWEQYAQHAIEIYKKMSFEKLGGRAHEATNNF